MPFPIFVRKGVLIAGVVLTLAPGPPLSPAQSTPPIPYRGQSGTPPLYRLNSQLVFLDVTVLDKNGAFVVTGLTKQDFSITDNKKPQRIFSFEAPDASAAAGKAPSTILVLDRLNSSFSDFAVILEAAERYLKRQREELPSPTELLLVDNRSLEMLVGYTRDRDDLLDALKHIPGALPWKLMNGAYYEDRFIQSMEALQEIALQNNGIEGRKILIWIGQGAPGMNSDRMDPFSVERLKDYVHHTANLMVANRMSLYLIYPGLGAGSVFYIQGPIEALRASKDLGNNDPFTGDIDFSLFVNNTGGKLFYNDNDVAGEIRQAQKLASDYYTLTYRPGGIPWNGKFHRIRVSPRDPTLHVVTKTGYFAPSKGDSIDPAQQLYLSLAQAAQTTFPYSQLRVSLDRVVRHSDSSTVDLTLRIQPSHLTWQVQPDGHHIATVTLVAVSLNGRRSFLSSIVRGLGIEGPAARWETAPIEPFHVVLRIPSKMSEVRIVVADDRTQALGSIDLSRKSIDAAPSEPTPVPTLRGPAGAQRGGPVATQ